MLTAYDEPQASLLPIAVAYAAAVGGAAEAAGAPCRPEFPHGALIEVLVVVFAASFGPTHAGQAQPCCSVG